MALERFDRIKETTTTTGTGTVSLSGTAPVGFLTFVTSVTSLATVRYFIESTDLTEWEVGEGVFTDGTPDTLSRVTVFASSNAGSLVDFSAGTKTASLSLVAEDLKQATGAEINTGTDDIKFATAKAIADSNVSFPDGTETLTNKTINADSNTISDITNSELGTATGELGGAWASWTPTWTNLTVGNGTVNAKYTQIGKTVHFRMSLVFGSTTSLTNSIAISLPVSVSTDYYHDTKTKIGFAHLEDAGVANYIGVIGVVGDDPTLLSVYYINASFGTSGISSIAPFTWSTGDQMLIQGTYEAA